MLLWQSGLRWTGRVKNIRKADSIVLENIQVTQKNWNFWKPQQKLKKSKKKNLLTEIEPLQLAF